MRNPRKKMFILSLRVVIDVNKLSTVLVHIFIEIKKRVNGSCVVILTDKSLWFEMSTVFRAGTAISLSLQARDVFFCCICFLLVARSPSMYGVRKYLEHTEQSGESIHVLEDITIPPYILSDCSMTKIIYSLTDIFLLVPLYIT